MLVRIPYRHQSGTFWYHPHKHGAVTYQMFRGIAGVLIVEGGPGTLDQVPAVKAAQDLVMAFQVIRATPDGEVPFVDPTASQFGTNPFHPVPAGLWSTLSGASSCIATCCSTKTSA